MNKITRFGWDSCGLLAACRELNRSTRCFVKEVFFMVFSDVINCRIIAY
ncbi:hypothetical protein EcWSU1_01730 [Enterobacter ludwigii]|uniref:Uncharacterized protein n=1 Tax=Enterobacter ludwigii TaxID=299767 RepID=G8LKD7_9ENTR|nr:hypothetical protein EcWSU1_01730 [Enterobacter ludwigii]